MTRSALLLCLALAGCVSRDKARDYLDRTVNAVDRIGVSAEKVGNFADETSTLLVPSLYANLEASRVLQADLSALARRLDKELTDKGEQVGDILWLVWSIGALLLWWLRKKLIYQPAKKVIAWARKLGKGKVGHP